MSLEVYPIRARASICDASAIAAVILALALLLGPIRAMAFGAQGHEVVGAIADRLLNPHASRQVAHLLGMSLQAAAPWADCVKDVRLDAGEFRYMPESHRQRACRVFETPAGIARMEDYVRRNWSACAAPGGHASACHKAYHYADVAIQRSRYDRADVGTSDHDIVSALRAAIDVLRGRPAPAPFSIKDRSEALLMLAHFVGDVHQPLHVGAIYLDADGRPVDPDAGAQTAHPAGSTGTRGGNAIDAGSTDLHAQWDQLPTSLRPSSVSARMLAAARAVPTSPGDVGAWPAEWASETLLAARAAYAGIAFEPQSSVTGHWTARFDDADAYHLSRRRLQTEQLTRAGARLAQVLKAVWP
ncbi:MAG: S1/P1 nuclease [Burkholderiales bacterium]|nr:S1/P1 nuclease [Burkholderiales bacterium]